MSKSQESVGFLPPNTIRSDEPAKESQYPAPKSEAEGIMIEKENVEPKGVTLDDELKKVRGNNCFLIVMSSLIIAFAWAELMVFSVPFLELIPPLECFINDSWIPCAEEVACIESIEYRMVSEDRYSLNNWVVDLDLICRDELEVGIIGAAIFAGMFVGALCLSPISDTFGRKPVHIIGLILSLIGGLWVYFSPSWTSVIVAMLCKGVGMYSRLAIAYLYIMELCDESRCKPMATIIMCINNSLSCLMATYFLVGGRDAKFFVFMSIIILIYALLFTPLIPESPKLLYSLKRYDDTRDSLERIQLLKLIKILISSFI